MERKTKVHRVVLMIVDTDDIGAKHVTDVIEDARYPNHCIAPSVMSIETREVDFDDSHPLNNGRTKRDAFVQLFATVD
jgi:hypothetical protein